MLSCGMTLVEMLFMNYFNIARFAHLAICPFMAQLGGICGLSVE
jgi:hypothetical protein